MISLPEINRLLIHDDDQRKNVPMSLDKAAENAELRLLPIRNFFRFSTRTIQKSASCDAREAVEGSKFQR